MPVITLEVLSDSSNPELYVPSTVDNVTEISTPIDVTPQDTTTGVHFLTEKTEDVSSKSENETQTEDNKEPPKARHDLLEYMMRNDGSVVCKLCGEILQSRTHWYRHKYKLHVIHPLNPAPLFQCDQCLVYFKSRKGYIGHLASRHSEILSDSSPVLTNSQAEALTREFAAQQAAQEEHDPELSIPKSSVPNYQTTPVKAAPAKTADLKRGYRAQRTVSETVAIEPTTKADWDEKRSREEKLVADIIDRVRRECEAQGGSGGAARRGYTRRTTVMNT